MSVHHGEDRSSVSIALILPSFASGGAERVSLTLISGMAPETTAVAVFDDHGPLKYFLPTAIEVHDLEEPRLRHVLPNLLRWLRASRPTVVFSTLGYVNLALLAMRPLLPTGTRLVVREANMPSFSMQRGRTPAPGLMKCGYQLLYPTADLVLCSSNMMAREMLSKFNVPTKRIAVLPNPVDSACLRACTPERTSGTGRRFVAAGRLTHQKGFDRLIDAFAEYRDDDQLCILGDGPDRARLEDRATARGIAARIRFLGFDPIPWRFYAGADAMLLSSRWEGMPNVALEAIACGTPVIATQEAGGIAELAAIAPPGAVTVAAWGDAFNDAVAKVTPSVPDEIRPSLLPAEHERNRVIERFKNLAAILTT